MTGQHTVAVAPADGRHEDDRLIRGRGRYLANVPRGPRTLHAVIVRSETPHGRIRAVDGAAAMAVDGVVAVLTVDDLRPVLDPLPSIVPGAPAYLPLAAGTVRYVGEP
ncbi:MAG: xanthine dehydrogenase family protein molybdopterin-binding subunit, partial [Acidimicrobiales bacterium]